MTRGGQVSETVPAETGWFQESVGTETCPQVGRSLDHQAHPVHPAPRRCEIEDHSLIYTTAEDLNF